MKKYIILIGALTVSSLAYSQVGINTANPQGVFNIDGAKDNATTGTPTTAQQANDFVVTSAGNVGIGTTTPSYKLEIKTGGISSNIIKGFKLVDGSQGNGYILTSDSNGLARWNPISLSTYNGSFTGIAGVNYSFTTNTGWSNTGAYITLPDGTWKVDLALLIKIRGNSGEVLPNTSWMWLKSSFAEGSNTSTTVSGDVGFSSSGDSGKFASVLISGPMTASGISANNKNHVLQGSVIIRNTSGATKTYYLIIGDSTAMDGNTSITSSNFYLQSVGGSGWSENTMIATSISL